MAKGIELTLDQARQHPSAFMYVWATDKFLNKIDPKYAKVIRVKRANQKKVLMLSADRYLGGYDKVQQYYDVIKTAFVDTYGLTPYEALIILAQGGEVAGKNWSEGVYGIGSTNTFGKQINGQTVTVDTKTGHILLGGEDVTDPDTIVYAEVGVGSKKRTVEYQLFSRTLDGYVFQSQYSNITKSYSAKRYSDADGKVYNASGKETGNTDSASIWGDITLNWDWLKNILNWILSIFGVPSIPELDTNTETLSASNTLPNQKADGFVSEAGTSETGVILLCAAAAGWLLMGKKGKKIKANK